PTNRLSGIHVPADRQLRGPRAGRSASEGANPDWTAPRYRSSLVEVVDDRARAVPRDHDDKELRPGRVLLDVDLARGDIDEVAGLGLHRLLDTGRAEGVAGPAR